MALLAVVIATRWTLAPRYLFYFDNINFALALDEFNPAKHQPQPPGDPLFVGVEQVLHTAIPSVKYTQLTAGALGSACALLAIWYLGNLLFGAPAGLLGAALLLFHPVFWLAGIGNHVRTFLTAGPIVVAICVWRAWRSSDSGRWFIYSGIALGIAAGFRPELLLLLAPLWLSTVVRRSLPVTTILTGVAALVGSVLPWLVVMAIKCGGWLVMVQVFGSYFRYHTSDTSFFFGGTAQRSTLVALLSVYWTGIGVLTWIWAISPARIRSHVWEAREQFALLAVWLVPPFLFHTFIHSDDPDHLLDVIPAVCLVGAWVLSGFLRDHPRFPVAMPAAIAMLLNALLFFVPPNPPGKEASYRWVRRVGDDMTASVDGLRQLEASGALDVVVYRHMTTAHQLSYYFPKDHFLTTDADLAAGCPNGSPNLHLPSSPRIALLLGDKAPPVSGISLRPSGPFLVSDRSPHEFRIGGCTIVVDSK